MKYIIGFITGIIASFIFVGFPLILILEIIFTSAIYYIFFITIYYFINQKVKGHKS